ncbi:uncharacterized protein ARMOST_14403 [Armillaria ostoyae]|uniref:Uncharacterized protein n=1 Tax=Armillaria ostoyae TaxID=47428 RepID=A0A284RQJ0_ARMOS|nr:uncharacterized protein ARMOST_14403 [Armillaria ostoyae]
MAAVRPQMAEAPYKRIRSRTSAFQSPSSRSFSLWPSSLPTGDPEATGGAEALSPPSEILPTDLIAPLQLGDLATLGLAGYTPAGFYQAFLEAFNYTIGWSWFWTIVFGAALSRALVAPWFVDASAYKTLPGMGQELARIEDIKDPARSVKAFRRIEERHAISLTRHTVGWAARAFMWTSTAWGVHAMCTLPVVQLAQGGGPWSLDLTAASPTWMNLALAGAFFSQSKLSSISLSPEDDGTVSIANVLLPLSAYGAVWVLELPAGTVLSVLTFSLAHSGQMILSRPPFRNLPEMRKPRPRALRDLPPTKHPKSRY